MLAISLILLTACAGSIKSVEPPVLAAPPDTFLLGCSSPVELPERALTQFESETYWIQDRKNLVQCKDRHASLADFYTDRDIRLSNVK
jgi:hypothetical protein